jgi:hypothetical protein
MADAFCAIEYGVRPMPMAILRCAPGHRECGDSTARAVIYGGLRGVASGVHKYGVRTMSMAIYGRGQCHCEYGEFSARAEIYGRAPAAFAFRASLS